MRKKEWLRESFLTEVNRVEKKRGADYLLPFSF